MAKFYSAGAGSSVGGNYATDQQMFVSNAGGTGDVWYVHYTNGTDAAAPSGLSRFFPLKTLAQAVTNAAAGDIIVLLDGSAESVTSSISISKSLVIVGEGSSAGVPGASLTLAHASNDLVSIAADDVVLQNIRFKAPSVASTGSLVYVGANDLLIDSCYFEMNENNDDYGVKVPVTVGGGLSIKDTTFISTATASRPYPALYCVSGSFIEISIELDGVVFDNGTVGFADASGYGYAADLSARAVQPLYATNLSLLRGAQLAVNRSNVQGYANVQTTTGGGQIVGVF